MPIFPTHSLDPLGHHALTCKYNGDVVSRQNRLRDALFESCRQAGVGGQMEVGSGLGMMNGAHGQQSSSSNWDLGKPAAFDHTVTSLLIQSLSMKQV